MKKILVGTLIVVVCLFMLSASNVLAQFCQHDRNFDGNVDSADVGTFLAEFGRSQYNNPCPPDGPAPVAKTGQYVNYYGHDDGYYERGVEWPDPRFTNNGDGTVTDNLTGLMWTKDAGLFGYKT